MNSHLQTPHNPLKYRKVLHQPCFIRVNPQSGAKAVAIIDYGLPPALGTETARQLVRYANLCSIRIAVATFKLNEEIFMQITTKRLAGWLSASALALGLVAIATPASAGIANTKHNLSSSTRGGSGIGDIYDTNQDQICVFCHTPHGANQAMSAPLWNKKTHNTNIYTVYSSGTMDGNTSGGPTAVSLACLSCHDGTQAMDNMINAAGSSGYDTNGQNGASNITAANAYGTNAFSMGDCWTSAGVAGCSAQGNGDLSAGNALAGNGISPATGAGVFMLGTDLSNDHPIGMNYAGCTGTGSVTAVGAGCDPDFHPATQTTNGNGTAKFYVGASAVMKQNMRLYGTSATAATVECASCHDPHSDVNPTFLRISNTGSAVCLTCHAK